MNWNSGPYFVPRFLSNGPSDRLLSCWSCWNNLTMISLSRFPGRPDTMMTSPEHLEERRVALESYLNTVLEHQLYREQGDMVSYRIFLLARQINTVAAKKESSAMFYSVFLFKYLKSFFWICGLWISSILFISFGHKGRNYSTDTTYKRCLFIIKYLLVRMIALCYCFDNKSDSLQ